MFESIKTQTNNQILKFELLVEFSQFDFMSIMILRLITRNNLRRVNFLRNVWISFLNSFKLTGHPNPHQRNL